MKGDSSRGTICSDASAQGEPNLDRPQGKSDQDKISPLSFLLMAGHISVDMVQGGIAAVIPFLVSQSGFSLAAAGGLVFASNLASAIIQPLFGFMGDKTARPWLMGAGVLISVFGLVGIGFFSNYWLVVLAALVSGVGNAMLHPEGGRLAYLVNGTRKAEGMSIFSVGGQIGFCVGPIFTVAAVSAFGLMGLSLYLLICVPVAVVLFAFVKRFRSFGTRESSVQSGTAPVKDRWGAYSLVLGVSSIRSIVFYGITSFAPLFIMGVFGLSEGFSASLITVFSAVGAFATLASGRVARKVSTPHIMIGCMVGLPIALLAFTYSPALGLSIAMIMVMGVCVNLFNPPAIALGQSYLPNHLGTASGLSFGVAVAAGGIASPLLGNLGDTAGLILSMWVLVALAVAGLVLSICVNRVNKGSRQ